MAGCTRIPEGQGGNPIRVDMLGGTFQFCERRYRSSDLVGLWMIDFKQHSVVRLNNERTISHVETPRLNMAMKLL